jgi:hypothetical protein
MPRCTIDQRSFSATAARTGNAVSCLIHYVRAKSPMMGCQQAIHSDARREADADAAYAASQRCDRVMLRDRHITTSRHG